MSCLRTIFGFIGFTLLTVGIAALFLARLPQTLNREIRELGGATTTIKEIADSSFGTDFTQENQPDLPLMVDGEALTTNTVGAAPELEQAVLEEISTADTAEQEFQVEVAEVQAEAVTAVQEIQPGLTSEEIQIVQDAVTSENTTLNNDIEVELVPLNVQAVTTPNNSGQGGAGAIAGYEQRTVELEWPRSFRVGGTGTVVVTLKALPTGGIEAVAEIAENQVIATPILISDNYNTHTARYTARLVAPDFTVDNSLTPQTQTLGRGEEGTWRWSLKAPDNSGAFVINIVINLEWQPKQAGVQPIAAKNIWGQALQVDVNYVFGEITVPQASTLGTALAVVGFAIQIPLLAEILGALRKLLFGRRRQTTARGRQQTTRRR